MKFPIHAFVLVSLLTFYSARAENVNVPDLEARVAKDDPEAELELGRAYHQGGHGVAIDFAKAADLYRKAAAHGNAKAMYNLGYIYHHGQGVQQDDAKATEWFQKAADLHLPAAEFQMGFAYFTGTEGCKEDYPQAIKWLTLAAQQSDKAAQPGRAASFLGYLYEEGLGTPKSHQQAIFWYTLGAESADPKAQFHLGQIYLQGMIAKQDLVLAYKWLKLAAARNEPLASHLFMEENAAHVFTPEIVAKGDQLVNEFQREHRLGAIGLLPPVGDPLGMPMDGKTKAAGAKSPGQPGVTNGASAAPPAK